MAQKYFKTGIPVASGFDLGSHAPLDSRSVVATLADRDSMPISQLYKGLMVFVEENAKYYVLVNHNDAYAELEWAELGGSAELATKVSDLETIVGKAATADASATGLVKDVDAIEEILNGTADASGLIKRVEDAEAAIEALPETFVTDVKDASGNSVVVDGIVTLGDYATKEEVAEKADASAVYSKTDADSTFVKSAGYVAFSQDEKNKLAGIAAGAEVNYIKSVGDNLAVDGEGKLTVSIPEVEVPFQSIAEGDKVLTLNEGVLSSTLSYAREDVGGVDSLVLKGVGGAVIGSVPVADFIADGMLESVTPEEGTNNFIFTFKTGNGTTESFKVDFSKYVDTYNADGTTIELGANNTFNVKAGVFEAAGEAAKVQTALTNYISTNDAAVAAKVDSSDYDAKVEAIDGSISAINEELAKKAVASEVTAALDLKANITDVNGSLALKVDASDYTTKVAEIDNSISVINTSLGNKVEKVEGSSLVSDTLIAKLSGMAEIKSVGENLSVSEAGELAVDLSEYAKSTDVANTYVAKEEGKGLSTNDLTDNLLAKLNGIAEGAEVNYVKTVGANLSVSEAGELTVDLSALATNDALTSGLATKLDASAKVNGVSFANGEATLTAGNIALESAITRTENGEEKNIYEATASIQSVLAGLSARIDTLDPNISGEFGVSSVSAGSGIEVSGASSTPIISVKISAVEGNIAEVKTDGIYVAAPEIPDMKSYWESI